MLADSHRMQLQPVAITITHLAYCRRLGVGTLDIVRDGVAETYILTATRVAGRATGMRFLKLSSGDAHFVDTAAEPWRCDCGDAKNRPSRPGGCRHVAALRLAAERLRADAAGSDGDA